MAAEKAQREQLLASLVANLNTGSSSTAAGPAAANSSNLFSASSDSTATLGGNGLTTSPSVAVEQQPTGPLDATQLASLLDSMLALGNNATPSGTTTTTATAGDQSAVSQHDLSPFLSASAAVHNRQSPSLSPDALIKRPSSNENMNCQFTPVKNKTHPYGASGTTTGTLSTAGNTVNGSHTYDGYLSSQSKSNSYADLYDANAPMTRSNPRMSKGSLLGPGVSSAGVSSSLESDALSLEQLYDLLPVSYSEEVQKEKKASMVSDSRLPPPGLEARTSTLLEAFRAGTASSDDHAFLQAMAALTASKGA
jgi:hypothetical protein